MNPPGAGSPAPPAPPAKADSQALLYLRRNTVSSFQEPTPSSLSCPFQIPTWREKRSFNFKVALNTCTRPTKVKTLSSQASENHQHLSPSVMVESIPQWWRDKGHLLVPRGGKLPAHVNPKRSVSHCSLARHHVGQYRESIGCSWLFQGLRRVARY